MMVMIMMKMMISIKIEENLEWLIRNPNFFELSQKKSHQNVLGFFENFVVKGSGSPVLAKSGPAFLASVLLVKRK